MNRTRNTRIGLALMAAGALLVVGIGWAAHAEAMPAMLVIELCMEGNG